MRSFRHGPEELLHLRILTRLVEVLDRVFPGTVSDEDEDEAPLEMDYTAWDGTERQKVYEERDDLMWSHLSDYEGLAVPLDVIEEMLEAEGLEKGREGRGIEIGDAGWQVVLDWRESHGDRVGT